MTIETTYAAFRGNLKRFLDRVTNDCEVVVVQRKGGRNVAIIAADELTRMMETAKAVHLRES